MFGRRRNTRSPRFTPSPASDDARRLVTASSSEYDNDRLACAAFSQRIATFPPRPASTCARVSASPRLNSGGIKLHGFQSDPT